MGPVAEAGSLKNLVATENTGKSEAIVTTRTTGTAASDGKGVAAEKTVNVIIESQTSVEVPMRARTTTADSSRTTSGVALLNGKATPQGHRQLRSRQHPPPTQSKIRPKRPGNERSAGGGEAEASRMHRPRGWRLAQWSQGARQDLEPLPHHPVGPERSEVHHHLHLLHLRRRGVLQQRTHCPRTAS